MSQTRKNCFVTLMLALFGFAVGIGLVSSNAWADAKTDADISVKVKKTGGKLIVDVILLVPATQQQAWVVLTDYNHMTSFISTLQASKITQNDGNKLLVSQQGRASMGIFSFSFDTVREITLVPQQEINSRVISGSIKQADASTRLSVEGNQTRISYHSETIPSGMVPAGTLLKFADQYARKQYIELRNEIIKRKNEAPKQ